jgi:hypothetical protein
MTGHKQSEAHSSANVAAVHNADLGQQYASRLPLR